ncbi:MAG: hypothetical protein LJE97_00830 [Betaproteobacteria bacterium]|jgi:hypothetical protein|nr:hypothetical protein [Betaproteobacteria bacterium]
MKTHRLASLCRRAGISAGFALVLPLSGIAADNAPPEALYVKVYPDHYVAAGKPFANLAAVQAWAKPILIRTVWLDFCGPVSTKKLLATVERFHSVYSDGIQVRTLSPGEAGCVSSADSKSSSQAAVGSLRADADLAADERSRSTRP